MSTQVVSELSDRLARGNTSWRTPALDPENDKITRFLVMCEFKPENGFQMDCDRIDMVFQFRKASWVSSEQFFDGWCPLARVYVDEMMATPVVAVQRERIRKGQRSYGECYTYAWSFFERLVSFESLQLL